MFIAIIIPAAKKQKNVLFAVVMAIAISYVFAYVPAFANVSSGWAIIIITILVSGIAAILFPVKEEVE